MLSQVWPDSSDWTARVQPFFKSNIWSDLDQFVKLQAELNNVFPPASQIFRAFETPGYAGTKVVILGQDPYHGAGQAHGLSFSVASGMKIPPSLRNIFKELQSDLGMEVARTHGDLSGWAKQGVLLLNTVLTVNEADANSHRKKGWEKFTDFVIEQLNEHPRNLVFILWGKPAEAKSKLIADRHHILSAPHPSPLSASRGFFGSRPFSKTNQILLSEGESPINWVESNS